VTKRGLLISAAVGLILSYGAVYLIPSQVKFAYAGSSCTRYFSLFPGLHKQSFREDVRFKINTEGRIHVGSMPIAATSLCVTPVAAPQEGNVQLSSAPFGGWLFRKQIAVQIPKTPTVNIAALTKPVPVTKPLNMVLDQPDNTFDYSINVEKSSSSCEVTNKMLECNLEPLKLKQGKNYTFELTRQFANTAAVKVASKEAKTLEAIKILNISVQPGEVVYSKPKEFTFTADKSIKSAEIKLEKIDGAKSSLIDSTSQVQDKKLTLSVSEELSRDADYKVTLSRMDAADGSALVEPNSTSFKVSGGPKFMSISTPNTGVGLSDRIAVTFDQELSAAQDVNKIAQISGANALISKQGNQVIFQLQGAAKCADITLTIQKGFLSKYDIQSETTWTHKFRTVCHTISTIGYSREGRAIPAYYFGNGAQTVLYMGAIHGNEKSSKYIMDSWIEDLETNARDIPADRQVVVVPLVNPDGFYSYGRHNAKNVNLNRNFPSHNWVSDIDLASGEVLVDGGGESPLSEPEAQAIASLTGALTPRIVATYHSQGSLVNSNDVGIAGSAGLRYAATTGYRFISNDQTLEIFDAKLITGTYEDWLIKQGIPAILMELNTNYGSHFSQNKAAMWALLKE